MELFNGIDFAKQREQVLKERVSQLQLQGNKFLLASIVFMEDAGSRLYTQKKLEAAERVGIEFQPVFLSLLDSKQQIINEINRLTIDPTVTGLMIQKPSKQIWLERVGESDFSEWWRALVATIRPEKDVDGLSPITQEAIAAGTWMEKGLVLPATAQAILLVLQETQVSKTDSIAIIGRSDIVGSPTFYSLKKLGYKPTLFGRTELAGRIASGQQLKDFDVVISATGVEHLITGSMLKENVILVDVGEPKPDIDRQSVENISTFLSPVPGGVGPITVVSLLENAVSLVQRN
ncbi:bifunctional 5,10-methylenetetrahydrofolate dehydrogenase/5,10-methenyltetrahydrofolate cyclohydrolase [Candidatus Woesebacteria bacterium]|nr:bifunctional 5,10-methylenetetrahydrofolate dehydrogenase/5,10-methenyltetrahydrofolate cyclohydrolase [Candidatus Woesebacteria bacterium]